MSQSHGWKHNASDVFPLRCFLVPPNCGDAIGQRRQFTAKGLVSDREKRAYAPKIRVSPKMDHVFGMKNFQLFVIYKCL